MWVKGTDLAVRGQHPSVGQGNWPDSQGPAPWCGPREMTWQVKNQHHCVGQGNWPGSQEPVPLRRVTGAARKVKHQHPHVGLHLCPPCYSPWMVCLVHPSRDQYRLPSHKVWEISTAVCKDDDVDLMSSDLELTYSGQFCKEATEVFLTANNWSTVSMIHDAVSRLFKRAKTSTRKVHAALTMSITTQSHTYSREGKHPKEKRVQHWPCWGPFGSLPCWWSCGLRGKCGEGHASAPHGCSSCLDACGLLSHTTASLLWTPALQQAQRPQLF